MRKKRILTTLSIGLMATSGFLTSTAIARTWTSTDGKPLQGIFLGSDGTNYKFKMANGSEITVSKDRFIKADQEAAERLAKIGDDSFTKASARQIDTLLAGGLKKNGFTSFNEPLPDDLFVRRVYLDIIGRIPTRQEFLAFAENARPDKREALIDDLLLSPGFSSNLFNYFGDMYRLHASDFNNGIRMDPYINWWREKLAANTPYHQIVAEMLTAKGNVGQSPASGFLLRDTGMEFDAFSNFGQVMLGIDISCAQCHDHPFDEWTQGDFYEMAAFFGNTQRSLGYRPSSAMMGGGSVQMPNAPEGWRDNFMKWAETNKGIVPKDQNSNQFRFFVAALGWNIADNETMETVLPHDFRGEGGKPDEIASPRTLIGDAAKVGGKTRREAITDWLTSPTNPRFALVIANRMWGRAFGRAILEPVNDFSDDDIKRASQPEVLKHVEKEMRRVNYDLREFMRILYNTRAYQSIATSDEPDLSKPYYFSGPVLRRMRAEQAWDSMMVLAHGAEIDQKTGGDGSFYKKVLNIDFNTATNDDVWRHYEMWQNLRGGASMAMVSESGDDYSPVSVTDTDLRASQLSQPAPAASMLDTFGQSDRRITDDHNFDGSVPQVLALMNGNVTQQLTGATSKVVSDLEALDGPDDKVRGVFFTLLNRFPSKDELDLGTGMIEDFGDEGISDLAWALMNSPEFLFIQ
ncbi:MAG: DUF1549 domain-containing protein [Verrucomicrobiales bacterium]|jgi:hypothetical protein|nr:DUF1549 domain-containing protein [Verrucomicrobiales bacterium]